MLPPDTLVMANSLVKTPSSFSLRITPRWNNEARNPPPERQRTGPTSELPSPSDGPFLKCWS